MVTKERLHQLVEVLPEAEIETAARVLEALGGLPPGASPHTAETAPFDDEPESEDEAALVAEAMAELARGDFVAHAEIRRTLGH
jgi:hypothetical protein